MTRKNKHISEEDFQRYLNNQMTYAECNAFERELQKHPFEAEALEGFQQISPDDLENDLIELHSEIDSKKQKPRYRYWAVAATILLLVTSGILWFQLRNETPVPTVTENEMVPKTDTATESRITPTQKSAVVKNITIDTTEETEDATSGTLEKTEESKERKINAVKVLSATKTETLNIADNSADIQTIRDTEIPSVNPIAEVKFMDEVEYQSSVGKVSLQKITSTESEAIRLVDSIRGSLPMKQKNFVKASVISDEQVMDSYVTEEYNEPAFAKKEFSTILPPTDTIRLGRNIQDKSRASQIRIRGYAGPVTRKAATTAIDTNLNVELQPEAGMELFENYVELNAIIPDDYRKNREVVKLTVSFDKSGLITGFENRNSADSLLFEMARSIIKDGPKWNPEIKNGKPVTSEKELKIVFKKKK